MPGYTHWSVRAQHWTSLEWIKVSALVSLIRQLDGLPFTVAQRRQGMIDQIGNMTRDAPFSRTVQFPEWDGYVCLDHGDWPTKFAQLMSALNYRSAEQNREGKDRGGQAQRPEEERQVVPNDVLLSFTQAVKTMRLQLSVRAPGVYYRDTVESELGLGGFT